MNSFFFFKKDQIRFKICHKIICCECASKYITQTCPCNILQYTVVFHGCKNDNFQMNFLYIFLIFAQNIGCGYTLEPSQ